MGKKIILRGADYSDNAISLEVWYQTWNYVTSTGVGNGSTAGRTSYCGDRLTSAALNVPINLIRINFGTLSMTESTFYVGRFAVGDSLSDITPLMSFSLDADDITNGYKILQLPTAQVITSEDETIGIGLVGKGYMPLCYTTGVTGEFNGFRGTSWGTGGIIATTSYHLSISYGYTE